MFAEHVHINQKTIRHTPAEKLYDALIVILAGAHGLSEINTRLRTDTALQRAFGRQACAEQSVVQDTLDACTDENVRQLEGVCAALLRQHGRAYAHDYRAGLQLLDIDLTGLPCGPQAELSAKGYFADSGIRYGRQLGRVLASRYEEIVVDQVFAGNLQLRTTLQTLVRAAEDSLALDYTRRSRTVIRMDAGGGTLDDVNWCLDRGYQLHCKDISSKRAETWATTVEEWFDDPARPGRQLGWVVPMSTPDYTRSVKRLALRWHTRGGKPRYSLLISTLEPHEVIALAALPPAHLYEPEMVALAYAHLYDQRAGTVEIEIKEDKQGIGLTKRRKKRAAAQRIIQLLNTLAHNLLVWVRRWLSEVEVRILRYGMLRLVRDLFGVTGTVETTAAGTVTRIVLNRGSTAARMLLAAFQSLLAPHAVQVELG
jgi:hypothetical protein